MSKIVERNFWSIFFSFELFFSFTHCFFVTNRHFAEFDVTLDHRSPITTTSVAQILIEENVGHGYEIIGHQISNFAENLENQRESIAKEAVEFYEGPLANRTALIVENIENGSAIVADNFSSFLFWLGHTLISIGYQTKKFVHFTFRSIGEFLGDTIEQGETFLGTQLIKTGENIHIASIDLERNSHDDGENLRKKLIEKTPQIENSIRRIIDRIAHRIHQIGEQTEMNGNELVNRHRFIENLQQIR